jgi:hypothetical protein
LLKAQEQINSFRRKIGSSSKIIKNFELFKKYLELPKLDIKADVITLTKMLNDYIKRGRVRTIPTDYANISDVVDQYFNQKHPFSSKKRHEFPDAIAVSAIENWWLWVTTVRFRRRSAVVCDIITRKRTVPGAGKAGNDPG